MKYSDEKTVHISTVVLAIGLLLASTLGVLYYDKSSRLETEQNLSTLTADSLTVVKNSLQSEVGLLTNQLAGEKADNDHLEASIETKNAYIKSKEALLKHTKERLSLLENSENTQMLNLNKQITELQNMKKVLEKTIAESLDKTSTLNNANMALKEKNKELESRVNELKSKNNEMQNMITADKFEIEVLKPNNKLTAKAKKAQILRISMRIPEILKSKAVEKQPVYLTITDNKNNPISGAIKEVTVKGEDNKFIKIEAHEIKMIDFSENPQKISFDFTVQNKLSPGSYSAKVFTSTNYLGTIEFKVRNSFLFF